MSAQVYDAIVIGAGSVGLPTALFLAEAGVKTLVIDQFAGPGQGSNKAAIGGIRATHSSPAKIRLCLESLRIFSTWEQCARRRHRVVPGRLRVRRLPGAGRAVAEGPAEGSSRATA